MSTRTALKAFFQTGDVPTEVQFADLIDSLAHTTDDSVATQSWVASAYQPLDAELTALAGLVSSADKGIQFTGSGTAGLFDLTAAAKTVLDDASVSAMVDTLGGASSSGTGGLVRITSATLVTPAVGTASANDNSTRAASTAYVDSAIASAVAGLLDFKGNTDASTNPNYPAASKGDTYYISVAGKIGGASGKSVDVGDAVIANADNAGGTEASVGTSWFVLEHNLTGALLAANNLSDIANAGTARTNLGLGSLATQSGTFSGTSSGTNTGDQDLSSYATTTAVAAAYQPLDADLTALAGLTSAANKGIQFTGSGTAATFDLTTAGKALIDDADAAAQRTTLGLGTMSVKSTYQIQIALSGYNTAVSTGTKKGQCRVPIAGTITGFLITCDPANKPSAAAIQCDLNTVDASTGAETTCLTSVASIATGAATSTGGAISGSPSVAAGDQLAVDIDQGSDGKGLIATITITAS